MPYAFIALSACVLCASDILPYGRSGIDLDRLRVESVVRAYVPSGDTAAKGCRSIRPVDRRVTHIIATIISGDAAIVAAASADRERKWTEYLVLRLEEGRWRVVSRVPAVREIAL